MEYINDGGYGEPVPIGHFKYTPIEFKCPREFWSQYTKYLERLYNIFNNAAQRLLKDNPKNLVSDDYGKLALYRLFVGIRLNNSLYNDAENAGFFSERDIIEYYDSKKKK